MSGKHLKIKFQALESKGLSETLSAMAENCIRYRKWGDLGDYGKYKDIILEKTRLYQPDFTQVLFNLFNEA